MANFHLTADIPSIRIDDTHILRARVTRENGEHVDAEIDLNQYIGNIDGNHRLKPPLKLLGQHIANT